VLTTKVKTAFYQKNQVWAAFLDITGAYDNVLIDIFCRELRKEGVPIPLVLLLGNMMWEKHLYFFTGQDVAFMRTSYKGLPQGPILSPFMYNFYTRLFEACLFPLCSILQYADDLVVYISGKHVEGVWDYLQTQD
jgi:hypothetical protein